MSEQLTVKNVKCGGCVSSIQEKLGTLAGIDNIEVDIATGLVTIDGNGIDMNSVRQCLTDAGFPPAD